MWREKPCQQNTSNQPGVVNTFSDCFFFFFVLLQESFVHNFEILFSNFEVLFPNFEVLFPNLKFCSQILKFWSQFLSFISIFEICSHFKKLCSRFWSFVLNFEVLFTINQPGVVNTFSDYFFCFTPGKFCSQVLISIFKFFFFNVTQHVFIELKDICPFSKPTWYQ